MIAYINTQTLAYPLYDGDIQVLFPNVSFSTPFVAPEGYAPVTPTPRPAEDYTKAITEAQPQELEGVWTQVWEVKDASDEVISQRLNDQWTRVRRDRNTRLTKCDWTHLADSPLGDTDKAAWATYRQALRDITTQPDPFNIVWPVEP